MAINIDKLTLDQLDNLIANYEKRGRGADPACVEARALRAAKRPRKVSDAKGLDLARTREVIRQAAERRQFLSYGAIAEANGIEWHQFAVIQHLIDLCHDSHVRGWPMLSAVVVNQNNLETGALDPNSLAGFIKVARALGHEVTDQESFLREQQERTFEWARQLEIKTEV